jgi:hypothetical protein
MSVSAAIGGSIDSRERHTDENFHGVSCRTDGHSNHDETSPNDSQVAMAEEVGESNHKMTGPRFALRLDIALAQIAPMS